MVSARLSKNALRYILLGYHGITATIVLTLSALIYKDRIFVPAVISAIVADIYIPTTIYLAWKDPGYSFLTVGKEVCYLLAQGLLIFILSVISALSTKDDTCSSITTIQSSTSSSTTKFTNLDQFDDIEIIEATKNALKCRQILAVSILSFLHLLNILCWLGLLFILVHRHRGHKKPNEIDAFNISIHRFIRNRSDSSRFPEPEGGDSTPIESLTKKTTGSPISPHKEHKRNQSTSSSGGSGTRIDDNYGQSIDLNDDDGGDRRNNRHSSTVSEPWRISSLPLPDLKLHFDSARNSAKSTTSNGGGFNFSFSNSNPLNRISTKSNGFKANLPTLESTRNSIQSWRRGDDNDLESLRKDHKRIESWRISPLPLPDLNLGFDTKSTKSTKTRDNGGKGETESIRNSQQSGLSGLTLEDARNSIQSLKSNPTTRDSLKSQMSSANVPMPKSLERVQQKRETGSLDVPSFREANQFRSTFRFNPDLETHRDSMETLRRDAKRIESWRISPIPWPTNSRRNSEDQPKKNNSARVEPKGINRHNHSIYMIQNEHLNDSNDNSSTGDLGLGLGLGSINGLSVPGSTAPTAVASGAGVQNKRLSNIRNSAQSGFSLEHVRNSVRSQIGEVFEIQEHSQADDQSLLDSIETRSNRQTFGNTTGTLLKGGHRRDSSWGDDTSFSSIGGETGNRLSNFSANFNGSISINENQRRDPSLGVGTRKWGDSHNDPSSPQFSIGNDD